MVIILSLCIYHIFKLFKKLEYARFYATFEYGKGVKAGNNTEYNPKTKVSNKLI